MEFNLEELVKITLLNEEPEIVRMKQLKKEDKFRIESPNHKQCGVYVADEDASWDFSLASWSIVAHLVDL